MYSVMGAVRDCRAVKFDSCDNLLSSVHTILLIILWYVRLNIKTKLLLLLLLLFIFVLLGKNIGRQTATRIHEQKLNTR